MDTFYKGKRVLVTGASSGIGLALAKQLLDLEANLLLVARTPHKLRLVAAELGEQRRAEHQQIDLLSLDIADEQAVDGQLRPLVEKQPVDIVINNAGVACCDLLENLEPAVFRQMIDTNFLGQVWVTRAVLPAMQKRGAGIIANVGSMASAINIAGYTAYGASKSAMTGFTESLRNELAGSGIQVSLVLPSDVDTPQLHAESATKPVANKALSGSIQPLSAEHAARVILRGLRKGKAEILVSPLAGRLLLRICRLMPSVSKQVMDWIAARATR